MFPQEAYEHKIARQTLDRWIKSGTRNRISISGNSMRPFMNDGSLVEVEYGRHSVKKGNIVVYLRDDRLICHRVLRVVKEGEKTFYLTKGDAAVRFDKPLVSEKEIAGVVRAIIRRNKTARVTGLNWRLLGKLMAAGSCLVGLTTNVILFSRGLFSGRPDHGSDA